MSCSSPDFVPAGGRLDATVQTAVLHGPPGQRLGHAGHAFAVPFDMGKHGVARP